MSCHELSKHGYGAWLKPRPRVEVLRALARLGAEEPWSWTHAVRRRPLEAAVVRAEANRAWLAAGYGIRVANPLLDPRFTDAVARHGGRLGYAGRTDAMIKIFADLLPSQVLTRPTKATFNTAYHGQATHDFARAWDGRGVDHDLVDVDVLRSIWLSERVHAGTTALLQVAWLAAQGMPPSAA